MNFNAIDINLVLTTTFGDTPKNPRFDRNRFGGQLGGPVFKDKLFFFVNYERTPFGQASLPAGLSAPTAAGYTTLLGILTAGGGNTANVQALQNGSVAPTASGSVPF